MQVITVELVQLPDLSTWIRQEHTMTRIEIPDGVQLFDGEDDAPRPAKAAKRPRASTRRSAAPKADPPPPRLARKRESADGMDWVACRKRFAGGAGESLGKIAVSLGVPASRLYMRSASERWRDDRAEKSKRGVAGASAMTSPEGAVLRRRCSDCNQTTTADPCEHCGEPFAA